VGDDEDGGAVRAGNGAEAREEAADIHVAVGIDAVEEFADGVDDDEAAAVEGAEGVVDAVDVVGFRSGTGKATVTGAGCKSKHLRMH
jgi:hypothetical protein